MKKSVLFFCFAFLMHNVFAQQNITWNGATNANWSVAANWSPAILPGPSDTVILNSTNPCNVDIDPTIAAIRALGITSSNGLNNNTGAARTITISSNPVASTVLYVEAGSSFILDASPTSFGVSITTYGASGTNSAIVDGTMFIANTSSWSVSNGTASTNVVVSGTGTIHVPSAHTGTNVFVNSTSSNLQRFKIKLEPERRFGSGSGLSGWIYNNFYASH